MKNKKQMAAVLLSAILGITANSWFVQADSSVIQDDQQEPDSEAPDSMSCIQVKREIFIIMSISRIVMMEVSHMLYSLHFQVMKDCTFKA